MWAGGASFAAPSNTLPSAQQAAYAAGPIARIIGWNTNATGDAVLSSLIPWTQAIFEDVLYTNASASLAASTLAATLRDAAAGGGNSLGAVAALTGLTSAPLAVQQLLTVSRRIITSGLWLNASAGSGVAATVDVYVFGRIIA